MEIKLSSELLFHFTKTLKSLDGIINNGFEHRPIPEDLPLTGYNNTIFSFPGIIIHKFKFYAVCFSDIPFRFIRDHIDQYGEYGIAMTKDWAIENKITPIRYVHHNTPEFKTDSFYNILNSLRFIRESDGRMSKLFATILADKKTCEKFSEQTTEFCQANGCIKKDIVGAHVQKANSSDNNWYIYPLCNAHNKHVGELDVSDNYTLVSANKKETCG